MILRSALRLNVACIAAVLQAYRDAHINQRICTSSAIAGRGISSSIFDQSWKPIVHSEAGHFLPGFQALSGFPVIRTSFTASPTANTERSRRTSSTETGTAPLRLRVWLAHCLTVCLAPEIWCWVLCEDNVQHGGQFLKCGSVLTFLTPIVFAYHSEITPAGDCSTTAKCHISITEHVFLAVLCFLVTPWDGKLGVVCLVFLGDGNVFGVLVLLPSANRGEVDDIYFLEIIWCYRFDFFASPFPASPSSRMNGLGGTPSTLVTLSVPCRECLLFPWTDTIVDKTRYQCCAPSPGATSGWFVW